MLELSLANAAAYLRTRHDAPAPPWTVTPLGGGVSNTVLLVESPLGRFVLKQSLPRLRVDQEWLADRRRIHRESLALGELGPVMPAGSIPKVLFEDPGNFIYAMTAAPSGSLDWKTLLLGGSPSGDIAATAAQILAALIRHSFQSTRWHTQFGDQTCFDQLRLDPYYRFTANRHPDLRDHFQLCIDSCRDHACCLVHGDFSPKNLLVHGSTVILIDFEVIHYGDPAFDSAFLLNHLLLKKAHGVPGCDDLARRFWSTLTAEIQLEGFQARTIRHLACQHLARVDGKSPAEYLSARERTRVRAAARRLLLEPPKTVQEIFS